MSKLPGMLGEVHFGDVDRPLPDWRKEAGPKDDEDDVELTAEERKALVGVLGFDPAEIEEASPAQHSCSSSPHRYAFDPNEPRNESGEWTEGGGTGKPEGEMAKAKPKPTFAVKPPKKLYRGVLASGQGAGTYSLGKGLYSTLRKAFLKGFAYDKIVELDPETAFPRNPLVLRTADMFSDWLLRESGLKNMREFNAAYKDPGEFVKSKGHDGVVAGDEVVKYTVDETPPIPVTSADHHSRPSSPRRYAFDPNEPRDESGQWTATGSTHEERHSSWRAHKVKLDAAHAEAKAAHAEESRRVEAANAEAEAAWQGRQDTRDEKREKLKIDNVEAAGDAAGYQPPSPQLAGDESPDEAQQVGIEYAQEIAAHFQSAFGPGGHLDRHLTDIGVTEADRARVQEPVSRGLAAIGKAGEKYAQAMRKLGEFRAKVTAHEAKEPPEPAEGIDEAWEAAHERWETQKDLLDGHFDKLDENATEAGEAVDGFFNDVQEKLGPIVERIETRLEKELDAADAADQQPEEEPEPEAPDELEYPDEPEEKEEESDDDFDEALDDEPEEEEADE